MTVTANIVATCSVSADPLAFGTVVPGTAKDAEAVVSATCTSGTAYTLDLGNGANSSTTVGTTTPFRRQMASGASMLPYGLYQESARTTAIDATATGAASNNFLTTTLGDAEVQTKTVYGRIFAAESAAKVPGSYSDTVVVTVAF
jgi:spore coat protein U-like protein